MLGVGPALIEEIFFRGVLLRLLDQRFGSMVALAATSLFFGRAHLANPEGTVAGALAIALEAGLMLGAAFLLTRRLWLAIGIHLAWNFFQGGVFGGNVSGSDLNESGGLFRSELSGPDWLTGGTIGVEGSVVAVLICVAAGLIMLREASRR